jgi:hypothetical protein
VDAIYRLAKIEGAGTKRFTTPRPALVCQRLLARPALGRAPMWTKASLRWALGGQNEAQERDIKSQHWSPDR